ncbi:hypothetical protein [Helicobacter trogontum]|uniref:Thiamine-phosphate pyrophosphorylase n=1 Tax=Helicobacter trogontum TaxID=50960 RepID=A0A4U8TGB3_9HELI|nr:hypothetical protein [Helicobacter trogontum]TLD98468.1 thiamine-phosphate pyrophosphorylase [Helicobacter trogontum]
MNTNNTHTILRILDANLNRLQEGIRVVEDIFRYIYDNKEITYMLKQMRHKAILHYTDLLLQARDVGRDIAKESIDTEVERLDLAAILHANFHRISESARVLEECLKLDECKKFGKSQTFKILRYEAYNLHAIATKILTDSIP